MTKLRWRVWDGKKMWYPEDDELSFERWLISQKGLVCQLHRNVDADGVEEGPDIVAMSITSLLNKTPAIMMSTGLKDRNGMEVWDGDIVEFDEKEWGNPLNKWIVQWDKNYAYWDMGGGTLSEFSRYNTVIGNIYQNPEIELP